MEKISLNIFLFFFLPSLLVSASSHTVPAIFTFGDSIVDAGNNHFNLNCTVQADFPPYGLSFFHHPTGRFTNGRTVVDFICEYLKMDFVKPFLEVEMEIFNGSRKDYPSNGLNFASAGSGVLNATNKDMGVMSIQDQLHLFENLMKQEKLDKKLIQHSMFFFESGSNDIFNYFLSFDTPIPDPETYVQGMLTEVEKFVSRIYHLGARRIAVFSLGPVGCIPARLNLPGAPTLRCYGKLNKMVKRYNNGLETLVKDMPNKYPGAVGVYGAIYDVVQLFLANPKRYRFSNTSSACCGLGTLGGFVQCGKDKYEMCKNPNEFLFWDYFHPTEHAYKLISKALWGGRRSRVRPYNLKDLADMAP